MKPKLQALASRKAAGLIQLALDEPEALREPSLTEEDNAAIQRALLRIREGLLNDAALLEQHELSAATINRPAR